MIPLLLLGELLPGPSSISTRSALGSARRRFRRDPVGRSFLDEKLLSCRRRRQEDRVHQYVFRIPFAPTPAAGNTSTRGRESRACSQRDVLIFSLFDEVLDQQQNLWHVDPVAPAPVGDFMRRLVENGTKHSPLIGYAFDGYPIYGPWVQVDGGLRRMRAQLPAAEDHAAH